MKKLLLLLTMLIAFASVSLAQRTVTGTITDAKGETLVGASVIVKGTTIGTVTDVDGKFSLNVPTDATALNVSFTGFATQEIAIGASNVLNVAMQDDAASLKEVVVTAIGISRERKSLGYSATDVKGEDLALKSESDPLRALSSKVAGVDIIGGGGAPGQSTKINIRGFSSLTGNTQPLFVVDGVPFDNSVNNENSGGQGTQYSNRAYDIDPNNIESMTVLKGASAAALYGARATNGVILITTKTGKKGKKGSEITFSSSVATEQISNLPDYQNQFTQGSSGNYNGGFIGNWGAPFPEYAASINQQYWGGENRYDPSKYNSGYAAGTIPNQLTGVGYGKGKGYPKVFPELLEPDPNNAGKFRARSETLTSHDNIGQFFQKGLLVENSLSFNTGSDATGLSATISRSDNKGIVENQASSRSSLSFGGHSKLANGLTIQGNVTYVNTTQQTPPVAPSYYTDYGGQGDVSVYSRVFYLPRNFDLFGNPFENPVSGDNVFYRNLDNPRWLTKYGKFTDNVNRAFGNMTLSYDVAPWLNLLLRGGVNTYTENQFYGLRSGSAFAPTGFVFTNDVSRLEINSDFVATVNHQLTKDIGFRFVAGFNANQRNKTNKAIQGTGVITPTLVNLASTTTQNVFADYNELTRLFGLYGDLQFSYKNYLYLEGTLRNDWYSTLPQGKNTHLYPSISTSFVFSEALKLENNWFSYGKLRASYAEVGNEARPYQTGTVYNLSTPFIKADGSKYNRSTLNDILGNPALVHELTTEYEVGTELKFFKNRIGIDLSIYSRKSSDQITKKPVPNSNGFDQQVVNAGDISNKGIEFGLTLVHIRTKNFEWTTNINFTLNRSKVISVNGDPNDTSTVLYVGSSGLNALIAGQPYGAIYGSKNARVNNNDKNSPLLIDPVTGVPIPLPDNKVIGDPNAKFRIGMTNTFRFAGFSLSALFDWKQGGDLLSFTAASLLLRGQLVGSETREALRVVPGVVGNPQTYQAVLDDKGNTIKNTVGINAFDSHFSGGFGAYGATETNVYDATVFRLREVSLGYEIPKKLLKRTAIGSIRLSVNARNVWFYAPNLLKHLNIDPEVLPDTAASNAIGVDLGATPSTKRYGVNLFVTF